MGNGFRPHSPAAQPEPATAPAGLRARAHSISRRVDFAIALVRRVVAPIGVLAVLLSAFAATTPAQAAVDTTGPTLTVPAISSYVLGQETADTTNTESWTNWFAADGAYRAYKGTATDPSGICRYTVDEFHNAEGWNSEEVNATNTSSTSGQHTFYADADENSDDLGEIRINAYDCAGNVTSVNRLAAYIYVARDYAPPSRPAGDARHAPAPSHAAHLNQERVAEHSGERGR